MRQKIRSFLRGKYAWTATLLLVLCLLALCLVLAFAERRTAFYPDLTPEGLYTTSDEMYALCDRLQGDITITFCDEPDRLLGNEALRYVYVLATQIERHSPRITVETVNIRRDPTAVYRFRTTSASTLASDNVIVSSGARYRVFTADSFYTVSSDGDSTRYWSFNGEYKLATAMLSVSAVSRPKVYFSYGHGERYYVPESDTVHAALRPDSDPTLSAFYDLLLAEGLTVDYLDLSDGELAKIPDDCALLIVCDPERDYADPDLFAYRDNSPTDLLQRYLASECGALMVFKSPGRRLPELEALTEQWGIRFENAVVRDNTRSLGADRYLLSDYNTGENEMSYGVYESIASLAAPPRVVVPDSGAVSACWKTYEGATSGTSGVEAYCSAFLSTSEKAFAYDPVGGGLLSTTPARYHTSMLSTRLRLDGETGNSYYSYVFGCASPDMIANEWLSRASFANYDVVFSLVRYISRTDEYAGMELGGTSLNSSRMGGRRLVYSDLYASDTEVTLASGRTVVFPALTKSARIVLSVLVIALPTAAAAVCGWLVCRRRKYGNTGKERRERP